MLRVIKEIIKVLLALLGIPLCAVLLAFCFVVALLATVVKAFLLPFKTPIHATANTH